MTAKILRRETAYKESEQRFRRLFEQSNDGIIIHNQENRIIDVNRSLIKMIGYSRRRMLEKEISDFVVHKPDASLLSSLSMVSEDHSGWVETQFLRIDGQTIDVEISISVIDYDERLFQSVVRDITERKSAEKELNTHMKELTEVNRRLGVLVSNTTEREKMMVQLKKEVNDLLIHTNKPPKYEAPWKVEEFLEKIDQGIGDQK